VSGAASIVADVRRTVDLLVDLNDPAALRTAEALTRWLSGEDFESAAGLAPGWRRFLQLKARDLALAALVALHDGLDDKTLAHRILEGIERASRVRGIRPDGADGHYQDLSRLDIRLSARQWRRLIGETRGHRGSVNGHDSVAPSLPKPECPNIGS
jgi:hypothetical protein